jgi:tRNA(fMet)-specific endonuclease VapC
VAEPEFLLDTNVLVYLIGGGAPALRERVERQAPGSLVTSALCVAEVEYGLGGNSAARAAFDPLLALIAPLPFDLAAARRFAQIPFRRGRLDRLIAAHVLALGLVLVTSNEKDFEDVPGLKIENWTRP